MPIHPTPELDILDAIKQIDDLLRAMDIVPILEYRKIRYKLIRYNESFMTIELTANHIAYEKLYQAENDEKHGAAYNRIETFILSFFAVNEVVNLV